jgi:5-bromo-4-chloroindolyl phosphate hydrolysis protein
MKHKGFSLHQGKDIIAGIAGGAVFLLFFLGLKFNLWLALLIAIAAFLGISLLLGPAGKTFQFKPVEGFTPEMIAQIIDQGRQELNNIKASAAKITDTGVKTKVLELCELIDKILANIAKEPRGIKTIRKFLSYYLDATAKIVQQYVELSESEIRTPEIAATLRKVENTLDLIQNVFTKQMAKLLENDVLDLDTEIALLETTIKSEGLQ